MKRETYNLLVETNGVMIRGSESGVFYGLQTLQQLISETENKLLIPEVKIEDRPRFKYRGVLIDVARYYQTPEFLKKYIDVMAHYKLNVLHLHLTEDAGWRIEIKKYPELTRKGLGVPVRKWDKRQQNRIIFRMGDFIPKKKYGISYNMLTNGKLPLFRKLICQAT